MIGTTVVRGSVEISIATLDQRVPRARSIGAVETSKQRDRAAGCHFVDCADAVGSSVDRAAVQVAVGSLH